MKQPRMNRILRAAFSKMEVTEATEDLLLFPTQEDFDKGVRRDPMHCGFANCVARSCGATQAHFFARFVYIDHYGKDGVRRAYRYTISKSVADAIAAYDRGKAVKIKRAFILHAPSASMTLKAARAYAKAWSQSAFAKAMLNEKEAQRRLRQAQVDLERAQTLKREIAPASGTVKGRELEKRISAAKTELSKARDAAAAAVARAKELRKESVKTGHAKPHKHDIHVRSGQGAWMKALAKA